jgi:hypothetical protein
MDQRQDEHPAAGSLDAHILNPVAAIKDSVEDLVASDVASALAGVGVGDALATIGAIESIKRMLEAQQARLTAQVVHDRTQAREAQKHSARGVVKETARDIGLHRGVTMTLARRLVDAATAVPTQAPKLFSLWRAGKVGEEKVLSFFTDTKLLTDTGRTHADTELAPVAADVGAREWRERLQIISARLEPERTAEKARQALQDRHVHTKNRGDGMMNLSALLPGVAGQGVDTILSTYARSQKAAGDERSPGQIKADLLTGIILAWARATGQNPPGFARTHHIKLHGASPTPDSTDSDDASAGISQRASDLDCGGINDGAGGVGHEHPGCSSAEEVLPGFADADEALAAFAQYLRHPDRAGNCFGGEPGSESVPLAGGPGPGQVTGAPATPAATIPAGIGVVVNLVITDLTAFGFSDEPAQLFGLGSVPAPIAREMIRAAQAEHAATLRRLYTDPATGALVGMESSARAFSEGLGKLLAFRDRYCRHPYCDAPIRHLDHIHPHAHGGPTSFANGQGLCAGHNLIKDTNHTTTTPINTSAVGDTLTWSASDSGPHNAGSTTNGTATATTPGSPDGISVVDESGTGIGVGAIITRLVSGAEFTSPARTFPHENPLTVTENAYWAGYRAGRADTEANLTERETALQTLKTKVDTKHARLSSIRATLTRRARRLITEERDLDSRKANATLEELRLGRELKALKDARAQIDTMQLDAETALEIAEEVQTALNQDRAVFNQSRKELNNAWQDLAERMSHESARSLYLDELELRLIGEPTHQEMMSVD